MNSKFNILILEDDLKHRKELERIFKENALDKYNIFLSTTLEELQTLLHNCYYLGMSLDHKVPLKDREIAKKYDIEVIHKLYQYHPLGYKSIYTAYPEWDSAKSFGKKIDYYSKKELSSEEWVMKMYGILKEYKVFNPNNIDIYNDALNELFFPFVIFINKIMQEPQGVKYYQQLFLFSIEMFWILFCVISNIDVNKLKVINTIKAKLEYMKENILERSTPPTIELSKVLESDFLEDMIVFNSILDNNKCDFLSSEDCEDYMALLILKLNFFASNNFALNMKIRRNHIRQKEVVVEKIENRAFTTNEYIINFDRLPKNPLALHFVMRDYEEKSYFLELEEYLSIELGEMDGNIKVFSKLENKSLFPLGE